MTFKRKPYERKRTVHKPIPPSQQRSASFARADGWHEAVEKENMLRSEAYRRLFPRFPCINCGKVGRSQHAHTNGGKAKGMKNDDRDAMPLCADEPNSVGCHTLFDLYRLIPGGREAHVEQGKQWAAETRHQIESMGLWPKNLPRWIECD